MRIEILKINAAQQDVMDMSIQVEGTELMELCIERKVAKSFVLKPNS
jgi:hypothetical protein